MTEGLCLFQKENFTFIRSNWWENISIYRTFWYLSTLFGTTTFLSFILACLKNGQNLKNFKKSLKKNGNLTSDTGFALISTDFVRFSCNFTWSTMICIELFHIKIHTWMPLKWAKLEEFEKVIEKIQEFDLPYRFCSHFHRLCLFWL